MGSVFAKLAGQAAIAQSLPTAQEAPECVAVVELVLNLAHASVKPDSLVLIVHS